MTANKLLNNYLEALNMLDCKSINLRQVILDILKYLAEKESRQYLDDKLWAEICLETVGEEIHAIELPVLRKILEKYKILEDEKDGR